MKLKYNGTDERVFPSIGITLNAFTASAPKEETTTTKLSAAPDLKAGE